MAEASTESLLANLIGNGQGGGDAWAAVAATQPKKPAAAKTDGSGDKKLDELLGRVKRMVSPEGGQPAKIDGEFIPLEPSSLREARVSEGLLEALVMKFLLANGTATGREAAAQVRMAYKIVDELLRQLKNDQLVVYRDTAPMNDYVYQLTDLGRERARRYSDHSTYFGSAPVALEDYTASVKAQSLTRMRPTQADLDRAFADLLLNKRMMARLGPAINSGRGLFLYGAPGNGKTSASRGPSATAFGFHARSASKVKSCGSSIPAIMKRCRWKKPTGCSTTGRSTSVGCASSGRRSLWAAS